MRRKIGMFVLMLAMLTLLLPALIFAATQPGKHGKGRGGSVGLWQGGNDHGRHRYRGRNRITYGYKNYGQYRSAQVHRRNRYRMARRYYWRDGIRLSRWVRVYY